MSHMPSRLSINTWLSILASVALLLSLTLTGIGAAFAQDDGGEASSEASSAGTGIAIPIIDVERGRRLFVSKGCVICHAINDVGGRAAPALDAPEGARYIDVFDFMARMWRGSAAMASLQKMELGYQIELEGSELADIIGFVSDARQQRSFSQDDIPDLIEDWILDKPYEDWEAESPWE